MSSNIFSHNIFISQAFSFGSIVRLGEFDKTQQNENVKNFQHEEYTVKAAIVHRLFDENYTLNDIALLKLQQKVTYKPHIRPICILLNSTRKSEIDRIENFGATLWGLNEIRPYLSPRRSDINRLKSNECYASMGVTPESSQICAALDGGASCIELGSPLFKFIKLGGTPALPCTAFRAMALPEPVFIPIS